ncbi:hypothetical protein DMC47_20430 [Nostoc sp. 3335mG]|nr:hypothetical protein DMC47_20430 [Nostoc sp. 3335mG]
MPDLPSAAPPALVRLASHPASQAVSAPLWRGVRSVGITCTAGTAEQCVQLVTIARAGAPVPVDAADEAARARVQITADLTPVDGRDAIRLTVRPSIVMDDAQGEWVGPTQIARDGEDFAALATRALDRALPWRGARPNPRLTGEMN